MQCRQRILTFLGTKVGMVQYRHATKYHMTEETTNAFEQRQGRKKERVRVVVPCDWGDDDNNAVFLIEKEVKRVVVIFIAAATYAPAPAKGDGYGI